MCQNEYSSSFWYFFYTHSDDEFQWTFTIYIFVCFCQSRTLGLYPIDTKDSHEPWNVSSQFFFSSPSLWNIARYANSLLVLLPKYPKQDSAMLAAPNKYLCVDGLHVEKYSGFGLLKYRPFTSPHKCAAPYEARETISATPHLSGVHSMWRMEAKIWCGDDDDDPVECIK